MDLRKYSWNVSEPEYRKGSGLSYSTLSTVDRDGLQGLAKILSGEKKSSKSLTFGSIVDTLITEEDEFFNKFVVSDIKYPSDTIRAITNDLFQDYLALDTFDKESLSSLDKFSDERIIEACDKANYYVNYPDKSRIRYILGAEAYYTELCNSENKNVISAKEYNEGLMVANTLKSSYFQELFYSKEALAEKGIYVYFQLKFKLDGEYDVRCMFDIIKVDINNKTITPIDLKTTGHPEIEFKSSFYMWRYNLQSSLYSHVLREVLVGTPFEDFKIEPFRFLVINKQTLKPMMYIDKNSVDDNYIYTKDNTPLKTWRELYAISKKAIESNDFEDKVVETTELVVNL